MAILGIGSNYNNVHENVHATKQKEETKKNSQKGVLSICK